MAAPVDGTIESLDTTTRVHALSSVKDCGGPFRFFALPRELRNGVYQQLLHDFILPEPKPKGRIYYSPNGEGSFALASFCVPELLLLNHQFKREYMEEAFVNARATITVVPESHTLYDIVPRNLLAVLINLKHVEIRVVHRTSRFSKFLETTAKVKDQATALVALFPALQTLSLVLHGSVQSLLHDLDEQSVKELFATYSIARPDEELSSFRMETTLLLDGQLCSFRVQAMRHWVEEGWALPNTINKITYRATLSTGPHSLCGLDLNTESSEVIDLELLDQRFATLVG